MGEKSFKTMSASNEGIVVVGTRENWGEEEETGSVCLSVCLSVRLSVCLSVRTYASAMKFS